MFKIISNTLLGAILLITPAVNAQSGFRIDPHIQNITQDGATLIWESNEEETGSLTWGPKGEPLSNTIDAAKLGKIQRVRIKGLSAGTEYTYSIATGEDVKSASFITAPVDKDREITFIVVGDSRRWGNRWSETGMDEHVLQWNADVYVTMGDLVGDGHQYEQWPEHFGRFASITQSKWFVTARGNHEGSQIRGTENDWFAKYHELPGDGEPYAVFDWGNTHFVLVSYESTGREKDWTKSAQWLDRHLESVDSQYTVVAHHFPVYCTGYYSDDLSRKEPGINAGEFRKVLDKHNVTLNCTGHTHIYERHYPLRNNQRDDENGTWYVVNGGDINANFPDWWSAVTDDRQTQAKPTYTVYQMKSDRVVARTFAWSKVNNAIEEIDYFVIAPDPSIGAATLKNLSNQKGDSLRDGIKDLGALLFAPAAKPLLEYLDHDDESVRHAAARSLALLGNESIAPELVTYLTHSDPVVAASVARSLEAAMPGKLAKSVAKLVLDEAVNENVRFHLIGALQFHASEKLAADTMVKLLSAGITGELRNRASYTLADTATAKHTKAMLELVQAEESKYVTFTLARTLNKVTGNRVSLADKGPLANSEPGDRGAMVDRWRR
jgi:hypothetical protein